jgi:tetratricopeptide (TPR) repeat protein
LSALRWRPLGALLLLWLAGCTQWSPPAGTAASPTLELSATPFFPQARYQCGPAALATLLVDAGVETTPDQLAPQVYLPQRAGSLQPELIAASRRAGRIPYRLDPHWSAIEAELAAGRPVLVLQNLGFSFWPRWHYAVVIGHDARHEGVILRSGTERRQRLPMRQFLYSWQQSDHWALVVLKPGELPANVDSTRYLAELAVWERQGRNTAALRGYLAAVERWPDQPTARLGAGNMLHARGDHAAAAQQYRALLRLRPEDPVALNNLADTLAQLGCRDQALTLIERGLRQPALAPAVRDTMVATRAEISARPATAAATECAAPAAP